MPSQPATTLTQEERRRRGDDARSRSPTMVPTPAAPSPTPAHLDEPETPCLPTMAVASAPVDTQCG
eukprot:11734895-Prorocentrum_lima.AAC.1